MLNRVAYPFSDCCDGAVSFYDAKAAHVTPLIEFMGAVAERYPDAHPKKTLEEAHAALAEKTRTRGYSLRWAPSEPSASVRDIVVKHRPYVQPLDGVGEEALRSYLSTATSSHKRKELAKTPEANALADFIASDCVIPYPLCKNHSIDETNSIGRVYVLNAMKTLGWADTMEQRVRFVRSADAVRAAPIALAEFSDMDLHAQANLVLRIVNPVTLPWFGGGFSHPLLRFVSHICSSVTSMPIADVIAFLPAVLPYCVQNTTMHDKIIYL